jgi:hypothetical protein
MYHYEIYLNGSLIDHTNLEGIAILKWQSACLLGEGVLRRVYTGDDFDPLLHLPCMYKDGGWE